MIRDTLWLLTELTVLFFGVTLVIHLFQRRFGAERLRAWMGGTPLMSAVKGITIGFITPFCTYSAIPMLVGFRQAGVPPAGYVAFITAAPVLDPVLFGALVVIVGPRAALTYTAVAFTAAITIALIAQRSDIERHLKPIPPALGAAPRPVLTAPTAPSTNEADLGVAGVVDTEASCGSDSCGTNDDIPWRGAHTEIVGASRAAYRLLKSVAVLLLAGIAVGLAIESMVSPSTVATITGDNGAWSIPAAAAFGTPLYVHTSLFVPIADALTRAGVGIGAIVALTIAGAGANVPEFIILTRLANRGVIAIFFTYIFGVAVTGGLIAHFLLE